MWDKKKRELKDDRGKCWEKKKKDARQEKGDEGKEEKKRKIVTGGIRRGRDEDRVSKEKRES